MSHTPGPWRVQGHGNDADVYVAKKEVVAWVGDPFDKGETEANAHLIAAAPDMLEALEEVMGELDVEGLPCPLCGRNLTIGHRRNCIWHVVESAIRKARGEV